MCDASIAGNNIAGAQAVPAREQPQPKRERGKGATRLAKGGARFGGGKKHALVWRAAGRMRRGRVCPKKQQSPARLAGTQSP